MTLLQLSQYVSVLLDKDQKEVQELLEVAFAAISSTLIDEETVTIKGFGKWEVHHKGGKPHFKLFEYKKPVKNDRAEVLNKNIQLLDRYLK